MHAGRIAWWLSDYDHRYHLRQNTISQQVNSGCTWVPQPPPCTHTSVCIVANMNPLYVPVLEWILYPTIIHHSQVNNVWYLIPTHVSYTGEYFCQFNFVHCHYNRCFVSAGGYINSAKMPYTIYITSSYYFNAQSNSILGRGRDNVWATMNKQKLI